MNAAILIGKVKWDGVRVRIEYQQRRPDNRYDELAIASFDRPSPEFCTDLQALEVDVCEIGQLPASYTEGLGVRGVSFTYSDDGVMGACITGLKRVKTAKSPLVLNTPFITESGINEQDHGPFFSEETVNRLRAIVERAVAYIGGGERAQLELDMKTRAAEPPSGDVAVESALRAKDAAEYARLVGIDIGLAITDPDNPAIRAFAHKFTNCSISFGGRTLRIDGDGQISATSEP